MCTNGIGLLKHLEVVVNISDTYQHNTTDDELFLNYSDGHYVIIQKPDKIKYNPSYNSYYCKYIHGNAQLENIINFVDHWRFMYSSDCTYDKIILRLVDITLPKPATIMDAIFLCNTKNKYKHLVVYGHDNDYESATNSIDVHIDY